MLGVIGFGKPAAESDAKKAKIREVEAVLVIESTYCLWHHILVQSKVY
jgi:hypothetical protein